MNHHQTSQCAPSRVRERVERQRGWPEEIASGRADLHEDLITQLNKSATKDEAPVGRATSSGSTRLADDAEPGRARPIYWASHKLVGGSELQRRWHRIVAARVG
jgi:hypothetical protein